MDKCDIGILLIMIFFAILTFLIFALVVVISNNRHKKRLEELTLYQINVAATIDKSIPETLDLIIQESFTDYKIKFLYPMEEGFINSEREKQIRNELVQMVTNRISSAALDKISLFYNINNIADIIADKIYIIVMDYVTQHNAATNDDTN